MEGHFIESVKGRSSAGSALSASRGNFLPSKQMKAIPRLKEKKKRKKAGTKKTLEVDKKVA